MAKETAEMPLTKRMRKATQKIHNLSDNLVNMKLGLTLSDVSIWREGILTFTPIFQFLEEALGRHEDSLLGDLDVEGMRRSEAFDNVLQHYYGQEEWKEALKAKIQTEAVANYLRHLEEVEKEDPHRLAAYIYHLYMGLLSGGQILSLKKSITGNPDEKDDIFIFEAPHTVASLKKALRSGMEEMGGHLDPDAQEAIVQEGVKVFELNNTLIRSVKGVDDAFWKFILKMFIICTVLVAILAIILSKYFSS